MNTKDDLADMVIVNVAGRQEMSGAAIMMFGKEPQRFFPRSRVRFYDMKVPRQNFDMMDRS